MRQPKLLQQPSVLKKIYYPSYPIQIQNNNALLMVKQNNKKNINAGNILQYYYNNFNNKSTAKQTNIYNNNVLQRRRNELAFLHGKAPFSSTKRPLSIRLSTPKRMANLFGKNNYNKSDSQKRPLLMQNSTIVRMPPIYTISEDVDKCNTYQKNLYISSNSRPLFVRK